MAYVRTFSFVIPPERADEMEPGRNLYLATVNGTQIVAQNTSGFHRGGVWTRLLADGGIKVVCYTQWYSPTDIERYISTPMIRDYEADIARYHNEPLVEIFELLA
jgi:hypothetical protein